MFKPKTVNEYIFLAPKETQSKLKELRRLIKQAAPKAEEKLSYGMPYYGYKGRLAYFAHAKKHIGLYVMPPTIQEHKKELKGYVTSKATIQLPLDKKLPSALITKLIKLGVIRNELKNKKISNL
jgi:uncharacterized protein YdhG (YjbR/CyaY superfamily)